MQIMLINTNEVDGKNEYLIIPKERNSQCRVN